MADTYVDSMLGSGETILAEARQHWMALIRFALQPILVFLAAIGCYILGVWLSPSGDGLFDQIFRWLDTLLGLFTLGLFILAVCWFPIQCIRWIKRRYLVTDRRVLYIEGWLRRNSTDAGLSMITDVGFRQSFLGRRLGYADLVVATAANRPLHFREMRHANDFKKAIMAAQQGTVAARADQIMAQGGQASAGSPPDAAAVVIPASVAVAPEEPAAPPEPVVPWDGGDVPGIAEDDLPPSDPLIFGAMTAEATQAATPVEAEAVADTVPDEAPIKASVAAAAIEQEAPAPVVEAPAPVVEAPAPVVEAPAPVVEAPAPVVEAPAPVVEAPAPVVEAPAPVVEAPAPVVATGVEAVTEALAQLADQRDSGTISEEEYESRKQELLDRL